MARPNAPLVFLAALAAALGASAGCATPTLPLPPPSNLTAGPPDVDGIVTVTGMVLPDAYAFCLNLDRDQGVIQLAGPSGGFTLRIEASVGDYLSIWQELGTDSGPPLNIRVPAP